ncbi:hypothetical protein [Phaffia rhodozyma]|uniref:Uncharacterized protein n=1 Tax=Phaffia rhodozyma TaxID=264483 RepID=A0A0F7SJG5_PHARH|nr:hypothetical protein [Phaffia rhodozyma]
MGLFFKRRNQPTSSLNKDASLSTSTGHSNTNTGNATQVSTSSAVYLHPLPPPPSSISTRSSFSGSPSSSSFSPLPSPRGPLNSIPLDGPTEVLRSASYAQFTSHSSLSVNEHQNGLSDDSREKEPAYTQPSPVHSTFVLPDLSLSPPKLAPFRLSRSSLYVDDSQSSFFGEGRSPNEGSTSLGLQVDMNQTERVVVEPERRVDGRLDKRKSFDVTSRPRINPPPVSAPIPSVTPRTPLGPPTTSSLSLSPPRSHPPLRTTPSFPLPARPISQSQPMLTQRSSTPILRLHVPSSPCQEDEDTPVSGPSASTTSVLQGNKLNGRRRFFGMFGEGNTGKEGSVNRLADPPSTRFEDLTAQTVPSSSPVNTTSKIAPSGTTVAIPRPLPAQPAPPRPSTSFFGYPLKLGHSSKPSASAAAEDGRPPSPAESFKVISARRITTPDDVTNHLSSSYFPSTNILTPPVSAVSPGPGTSLPPTSATYPGLRIEQPGSQLRTKSNEWSRARKSSYNSVFMPDDEEGEEEEEEPMEVVGERKVSVGIFRRRRSSMGLEDLARGTIEPSEKIEEPDKRKNGLPNVGSNAGGESNDDDDRPLGLIRKSVADFSEISAPIPRANATRKDGFIVASRERRQSTFTADESDGPPTPAPSSTPVPVSAPSTSINPRFPPSMTLSAPSAVVPLPKFADDWTQSPSGIDHPGTSFFRPSRSVSPYRPLPSPKSESSSPGRPSTNAIPRRSSPFQPPLPVESMSIGNSPKELSKFQGPYSVSKPAAPLSNKNARRSSASTVDSETESESDSPNEEAELSSADAHHYSTARKSVPALASPGRNVKNSSSTANLSRVLPARAKSPATSMLSSRPNVSGRFTPKPLVSLPDNMTKPQLDRERSLATRRASGGDIDRSIDARDTLRPPTFKPVPARRGSESVLTTSANRLSAMEIDEDSDGYGHDDDVVAGQRFKKSFLITKPGAVVVNGGENVESASKPISGLKKDNKAKKVSAEVESDSDDNTPLGMVSPEGSARSAGTSTTTTTPTIKNGSKSKLTSTSTSSSNDSLSSHSSQPSASSALNLSGRVTTSTTAQPKSILRKPSASTIYIANNDQKIAQYRGSQYDVPVLNQAKPPSSSLSTSPSANQFTPRSPNNTEYSSQGSAVLGNPPRPAFHNSSHQMTSSPSSSCASGITTGDSSSGQMPMTPKEVSLDDIQKSRHIKEVGSVKELGLGKSGLGEGESLDENEIQKRRNERRRNEARNAIKLGQIVNGTQPIEETDDDDMTSRYAPVDRSAWGGNMMHHPPFPMYPPQGFYPSMPMMNGDPMMAFQMQMSMQAQQAQMAMQMAMAQMPGQQGDPHMQYQAMMMAKQQFQSMMAAQASQLAADQWETMSMHMGGAASEIGGPTSSLPRNSMRPMGMGVPFGDSVYGGGYSSSAYGGEDSHRRGSASAIGGGGPAMSGGTAGGHWSGSRSEYGDSSRRSRSPTLVQEGSAMRTSSYDINLSVPSAQPRSRRPSGSGVARLVDQIPSQPYAPPSSSVSSSSFAPAHRPIPGQRQSSSSNSQYGQPPDRSGILGESKQPRASLPDPSHQQQRSAKHRTSSGYSLSMEPPMAPFAKEEMRSRSPGRVSPRSGSPAGRNPPTSWRGPPT